MQYAAFLLGINVGSRTVKMADLKALMQREGYTNVSTVLASGNVVFCAPKQKPEVLAKKLEGLYEKKFGFAIGVIVRTMAEIEAMLAAEPFKKVKMTKDIRRYVTFRAEAGRGPAPKSTHEGYSILKAGQRETYSVLDLSTFAKTPDVMKLLGKTYGKKITTRNWNTIEKIAALADAS
ncbi:MAG TPA: DUF1697 domain-containing protein [Candidatus Paceibacterota bacterium]|nr:DUF1697 domain-containing protein [Candidatus Paceibacterota bacterium]